MLCRDIVEMFAMMLLLMRKRRRVVLFVMVTVALT